MSTTKYYEFGFKNNLWNKKNGITRTKILSKDIEKL